ncbi:MAG: hypothetical protein PHH06_04055, partial [Candidatus Gracilibacteria bacterium]|nr:hypothetical protein [Candidatus Gracilibacteria bacterium]
MKALYKKILGIILLLFTTQALASTSELTSQEVQNYTSNTSISNINAEYKTKLDIFLKKVSSS